jgi:methyl-accepting chemotaxis protein
MTTSQSYTEPSYADDTPNINPNSNLKARDEFAEKLDKLCAAIALIAESVNDLKTATLEQGKSVEKALQLATNQQLGMDKFVDAFYEQAKSVTELLLSLKESTEAARQLAKVGESSQAIAKSHQESIRDLLQELRQSRNN